jgi:hypothetical protein
MSKERIIVQDNGLVLVTPKGKSTHIYKTREVIEALEKQIPKKPIQDRYIKFCPQCNNSLDFPERYEYCTDCGQALDWSDTE